MQQNKKIKLKKGDLIVVSVLCAMCAVLFVFSRASSGKAVAIVTVNGETVYEAALADIKKSESFVLENGVVITAEPGAVYFSDSPCAGHDCVKTGRLTRPGQTAVCLPEKTVIRIIGKQDTNAPDAIT